MTTGALCNFNEYLTGVCFKGLHCHHIRNAVSRTELVVSGGIDAILCMAEPHVEAGLQITRY